MTVLAVAMMATAAYADGGVYGCGAFNGWDVTSLTEFGPTGVPNRWQSTIDFGQGREFKLTTTQPQAGLDVQSSWGEFDRGCIAVDSDVAVIADTWLPVTVGVNRANQQSPVNGYCTVIVDLDHAAMLYHTEGADIPDISGLSPSRCSGTLPVMYINTENNAPIVSKEDYLTATYYVDPMGVEGVEAIGSADAPLTMQIRGRGNYTWTGFDKKPYRLKLADKQPLLGMDKSKHFALLAHADDNLGFMRNVMGFEASRLLGLPWTPADAPVEVVLNGNYIGLYFLTETIRVDKNRVNVVEQDDLAETDVDGGWLVEIDNYDTDPHVTVYENGGNPIWFTYKSPELLSPAQETFLQTQMQAIDDAVYAADKSDISRLADLVDIDCLARYYIVQQIMQDGESFHGSCYLNRQRGADSRWMFGPVWDFGNAFAGYRGTDPDYIFRNAMFSQVWIGAIYEYPGFVDAVKRVWESFVDDGPSRLFDALEDVGHRIAKAGEANYKRWPQYGNDDIADRVAVMRTYLTNSIDWCKERWGYHGVVTDVVSDDGDMPVTYYNLQGMPVTAPVAGGIYIRVRGQHADTVRYRACALR